MRRFGQVEKSKPTGCRTGAAFEVVNVSDFDGEFLGSMPKEKNKAGLGFARWQHFGKKGSRVESRAAQG